MDELALELARDWMMRASHDLQAARLLSAAATPLLDAAIYHCQQAAEKSLKGWLQAQDDPFEKTHNVTKLVQQASALDPAFLGLAADAAIVTPYATAYRYPGGAYERLPTQVEFDEALASSERIYEFVRKLIPNGGASAQAIR